MADTCRRWRYGPGLKARQVEHADSSVSLYREEDRHIVAATGSVEQGRELAVTVQDSNQREGSVLTN